MLDVDSQKPPKGKWSTPPFDPRFPNQNQTRNCYQNFLGETLRARLGAGGERGEAGRGAPHLKMGRGSGTRLGGGDRWMEGKGTIVRRGGAWYGVARTESWRGGAWSGGGGPTMVGRGLVGSGRGLVWSGEDGALEERGLVWSGWANHGGPGSGRGGARPGEDRTKSRSGAREG